MDDQNRLTPARFLLGLLLAFVSPGTIAAQAQQSIHVRNQQGEPLVLATVIRLGSRTLVPLDSTATFRASASDSFEIRHIGFIAQKIYPPLPSYVTLADEPIKLSGVVVTPTENLSGVIGYPLTRRKRKGRSYVGQNIEFILEMVNPTAEPIRIQQVCIHLECDPLIPGAVTYYPPFELLLFECDSATGLPLRNVAAPKTQVGCSERGKHLVCVDVQAQDIVLQPGQKFYPGLRADGWVAGWYSTKAKTVELGDKIPANTTWDVPSDFITWGTRFSTVRERTPRKIAYRVTYLDSGWYFIDEERYVPAMYCTYTTVGH